MTATWVIGDSGIGAEVARDLNGRKHLSDVIHLTGSNTVDVRIPGEIRDWVQRMPNFDEVVYCAGINQLMPIGEIDQLGLLETFGVNVLGFINVINELYREDPTTKRSIVAIASDAAKSPMRHSLAYCSSKAALVQAVRVAARELAPLWRVNAVSPAIVADTPMTEYIDRSVAVMRGWSTEEALAYERSMIPMGRRGTKEEIANTVVSVLRGAEFMTGSNIEITGGK